MAYDESIKDIKTMHPTNDAIEEKEESFDEKPVVIDDTVVPMDVMEEADFDGWNVEVKDSDDNGSGLVARPSDVPISVRKTFMEILKEATTGGDLNPALMVTVSIAPIFQIDRPYKIKYNNISDEEFRELFWSSNEHEVTAICVDYGTGCLSFVTGYQAFLDGIKTKTFNLTTADIDKYDIRFTPFCTYAEAVAEYELKATKAKAKEEKEN